MLRVIRFCAAIFGAACCGVLYVACGTPLDSIDLSALEKAEERVKLAKENFKNQGGFYFTDTRDGTKYKAIPIGNQVWMAENLKFMTVKSYCYENQLANCEKYGRLYEWFDAYSACPEGWHLPNVSEWNVLLDAVGGVGSAGGKLRYVVGWQDNFNGTDEFGFSVLPAGSRDAEGEFNSLSYSAYFWSATENSDEAESLIFSYNNSGVPHNFFDKKFAYSVRCVQDIKLEEPSSSSEAVLPETDPESSSSEIITPSSSSVILNPDQESSGSEAVEPGTDPESSSKDDTTANTLKDVRDDQTYKTVTIGTQTWMAENLNYETKNSWCYDNALANCEKYGRLYTWSAVMDSAAQFSENAGTKCGYGETCTPNSPHRGICPQGWHVPTNEEYSALYTYVGGSSIAGTKLKSTTGWSNSGNGSDEYGFSVLPAGYGHYNDYFRNEGNYAGLWSASEDSSNDAWNHYFSYNYARANQNSSHKNFRRSLRCLKD